MTVLKEILFIGAAVVAYVLLMRLVIKFRGPT